MEPRKVRLIKDVLRSTVGGVVSLVTPAPQRFVIITSGRAGSNLLVSMLRQHPLVYVHSEIFGEYQLEDRSIRQHIRSMGPLPYFENSYRRTTIEKAIGNKILYHQLSDDYGPSRGVEGLDAVRKAIHSDHGLKFIHMKRMNKLEQLLSERLAERAKSWKGEKYSTDPIHVDIDDARRHFENMEAYERKYDGELPADRTMAMSYETFAADLRNELGKVFMFLGVSPIQAREKVKKQGSLPPSEAIANFNELKSAFSDTRFAEYFA